jgi:hypothetical protein
MTARGGLDLRPAASGQRRFCHVLDFRGTGVTRSDGEVLEAAATKLSDNAARITPASEEARVRGGVVQSSRPRRLLSQSSSGRHGKSSAAS